MAPLSGKQQREYLKFQNKEAREVSKMGLDEMRKQQLHELKLKEAAAKANQGLSHKEQVNNVKLKDMGIPPARMNKQKLGIPSQNPLAGTGMFKQGQRSLAQAPIFQARGTDTVPAMLTPGEAVIPQPAAQNPKNKKAIKRMVQEGRKANAMRDGTSGVPSLAYRHPDVPGSSFMHGTMSVPDFSRGSSAQANYANGSYGVVPQQVQSAAGYYNGTLDADIDEERKRQGVVPIIIQPTVENIPVWDERYPKDKAEAFANARAIERPPTAAVPSIVVDSEPSNAVTTSPTFVPVSLDTSVPVKSVPAPNVTVVPAMTKRDMVPEVSPQAVPVAQPTIAVGPLGPTPTELANVSSQMTTEQLIERDKVNAQNTPVASTVPAVPSKESLEPNFVSGKRKDYETDPVKASRKIRSVSEIVQELSGTQKTEKSFTDSLANLFTASGFKEELGLNNQDIIRMAISTAVGAKKFGVNRALAFAGRQAFEESFKRNAQQQADKKAIRAAAVQIRGQEVRDARAEESAEALEIRTVRREEARREHDRFVAAQQVKMAEIKDEYNRTRDEKRFEQQLRMMASNQASADRRFNAALGNQLVLMYAREDMKANNPIEMLKRMEAHTDKAASAVTEIFKRELGSDDVKDQPNPARSGLPTPKQTTQQSLSYLKRSGFDITNPDAAQEATALINQATEQMIADKKSGRVKEIKDITPYLARNVISSRLGLEENMFNVGKEGKPMPPEKMTELFGMVRVLTLDSDGKSDIKKQSEIANRIATEWNGPNGKNYRKEFGGTDTESAYAQFMKAQLKKLSDK